MSSKCGSVSLGYMDDDDNPLVYFAEGPDGLLGERKTLAGAKSVMVASMRAPDSAKGFYRVIDSHSTTHEMTRKW